MSEAAAPLPRLLLATAVFGAVAIASAPWALNQPWLNLVFKPLATCAVIAYAWGRGHDQPPQRRWILVGLVLSLFGDVALLWPEQGFLPGLVSFLLAHAAYLVALTREHRLARRWSPFIVYALVAALALSVLWPSVPTPLRAPVGAYVLLLVVMAAQAALLWRCGSARGAVLALGGASFVCSDTLLAFNKFVAPLPLASLWILASYWLAQVLIASWLSPGAAWERHAR
jgi:uncharacterized membrane protein YhhN